MPEMSTGLTLIVLTAGCIGVSGYLIKIPTTAWQPLPVPVQKQEWVYTQKRIMPLFENVCEDSTNSFIITLANDFDKDFGNGNNLNPDIIIALQNHKSVKGFLPKGEIFTEFNLSHMVELKLIYELLYYAKDFDTFYKAAAWARQNINCVLYVDAIYLAIFNRKDTENISIPPPYEILPNYFINKDAIIKGSMLLTNGELFDSENVREEGNSYVIDTCYSNGPYEDNLNSLTYFNEDIGLNSFYFFQKLNMLPWLNDTIGVRTKYGEQMYQLMKQLSTRYNLERYSNGLPELENLNWNTSPIISYDPMLIYSNGNDFGQRNLTKSLSSENLTFLQNIEDNIATVTTHLRDRGYTKEEIINHLMEILVIGNNSYQNIAYKLLGNDFPSEKSSPSVLAHYLTVIRDPVFWIVNKKIVDLVDYALCALPGYTRKDLIFPGVEIINVEVKKMLTSFEYFEFDATDALKISSSDTKFQTKIGQYRLNHKPFTVKLNISSLVTQKGFAKIFISPKVFPAELSQAKNLFFMLDCFEINLKKGKNIITRNSGDMKLSEDLTSLKIIKKQLEDTEFGLNALPLKMLESQTKFPLRLVLPKGSEDGLPFQIFVFVAPYIKPTIAGRFSKIEYNDEAMLTPSYPLDLNIDMHTILDMPNSILKEVIITHKTENKPTKDLGNNEDSSSGWKNYETDKSYELLKSPARPEYTMRKEPFDYKSQRGQYNKKDYSAKRPDFIKDNDELNKISTPFSDIDKTENKNVGYELIEIDYLPNDADKLHNDSSLFSLSSEEVKPIRLLGLSARPEDYTMKREPFDYKSKRGQYGKKDDYLEKREKYNKYKKDVPEVHTKVISTEKGTINIAEVTSEIYSETKVDSNNNNENETMNVLVSDDNAFKNIANVDENEKNNNNLQKSAENIKVESEYDIEVPRNDIASPPRKRTPTVYDYLFKNPFDKTDYFDEKIYV